MFSRVFVDYFGCLRQIEVPLRPLTVLIGKNDTGKSTFLRALMRLKNPSGFDTSELWRFDQNCDLLLQAELKGKRVGWAKSPQGSLDYHYWEVVNRLGAVGRYQLPVEGVQMESPGAKDDQDAPPIDSNGQRVPAMIDYLLRTDRKRFDQFEKAMRELIEGLERIEIATPTPERRRIDFVIDSGLRINGSFASAGVRLLVFFIALAYHPNPAHLILVEEPETGVHPKRLADVMRLLRDITRGVHGGHTAQVVLTTHSPYLLDLVDLSQDQVLVFDRKPDGSRTAEPADAARLKDFLDEFMLGEVWYNRGEEGLVAQAKA